jgi:hypothetical protein
MRYSWWATQAYYSAACSASPLIFAIRQKTPSSSEEGEAPAAQRDVPLGKLKFVPGRKLFALNN